MEFISRKFFMCNAIFFTCSNEPIGTANNIKIIYRDGFYTISGRWEGLRPCLKIADQETPLKVKLGNIAFSDCWFTHFHGKGIDDSFEATASLDL